MSNEKNKPGIIYTVKCKVTGEFYVGATTKSVDSRKKDHEQRASRSEDYTFGNAISTYGKEAFKWEQIDTAQNLDELARKEKKFIKKFDSKNNGFNSDSGGGIKKTVYQYNTESIELENKFTSLTEAAKNVNATEQQISRACLGVTKTVKGFYWSYDFPYVFVKDKRHKRVNQYLKTGEFVQSYSSVASASLKTQINKNSIAKVCRGERNTAGGYRWKYSC